MSGTRNQDIAFSVLGEEEIMEQGVFLVSSA